MLPFLISVAIAAMKLQADLILLCSALVHFRYCVFYKLKVCSNPAWSKSISALFSNSICSPLVSMSHFGNSQNISNFCIIVFAMVIIVFVKCHYCNVLGHHEPRPYKIAMFVDVF